MEQANILINTEIVAEDTYITYRNIPPTIFNDLLLSEQRLVDSTIARLKTIRKRMMAGEYNEWLGNHRWINK